MKVQAPPSPSSSDMPREGYAEGPEAADITAAKAGNVAARVLDRLREAGHRTLSAGRGLMADGWMSCSDPRARPGCKEQASPEDTSKNFDCIGGAEACCPGSCREGEEGVGGSAGRERDGCT
jgi:hypothetical protein